MKNRNKSIITLVLITAIFFTHYLYGVENEAYYTDYTVDNIREKLNEEIESIYGKLDFYEKEISDYGTFNQTLAQQGISLLKNKLIQKK